MADAVDPQGMLGIVRDTPGLWARGLATALDARVADVGEVRAVVVAGMGGSGIAGDVARLAADTAGRVPVVPCKGYRPPAWLGPDTPVVAVSHSGNTEETLAVARAARDVGAPLHAVTSGGALAELAAESGWDTTIVNGDLQPRASLPLLVAPVLVALEHWGVLDDATTQLRTLPDHLAAAVAADVAGEGAGRRLAGALRGRVGMFLGGRGVGALVATRAACQVAENAEDKAFSAELPEFDHNGLVGFATDSPGSSFVVVPVRDPDDHPRVAARFAPTIAALRPGVADVVELELGRGTWLQRLAGGILDVDLASVHLAIDLGRDPTPVDVLVALKADLAEIE